MLKLLSKIN